MQQQFTQPQNSRVALESETIPRSTTINPPRKFSSFAERADLREDPS